MREVVFSHPSEKITKIHITRYAQYHIRFTNSCFSCSSQRMNKLKSWLFQILLQPQNLWAVYKSVFKKISHVKKNKSCIKPTETAVVETIAAVKAKAKCFLILNDTFISAEVYLPIACSTVLQQVSFLL